MKKDKSIAFLTIGFACILIICVVIFVFLADNMNVRTSETMNHVGNIYMSSMNERLSMHFETTIAHRMRQIENVIKSCPPDSMEYDELNEQITYNAISRDLDELAYYTQNGEFEMIYGGQISIVDPAPFYKSICAGENKVAVGRDNNGKEIVLIGIPAEYTTSSGEKSRALVAAIAVDYIKQLLALEDNDSLVYSHIIRIDGTFVIGSSNITSNNYFDEIKSLLSEFGNAGSADTFVSELSSAMVKQEVYSNVLFMGNERRHLYCTALPYSEWYLVTVMPYGTLDDVLNEFGNGWLLILLACCGILVLAFSILFAMYIGFSRNQLKELNIAREKAEQATKAKSEFLSNMSHDIRTPMNAIVGMTAIAIANVDDKQQLQNCLHKIALSGKHLLGLINDVLDMSKIESGKLTLTVEQVSLREIMDNIVGIVQPQVKSKNQKFDIFIHNISVETVYCDSVRLNQVLLNLLSNAIKFTPDGGQIHISVHEEPSAKGEHFIRLHLYVKDNGIGMSEEFMTHIFEGFTREDNKRVHKTEGSGLGMAIVKYIVDAMGGTVEVNSKQGEGTEFHVTLDLEKAEVSESEMILPDWRMLVVDDDEELCNSAVASLKGIGISADSALDGETAVKMVREHHEKNRDYQIIMLDWKMPGMNGIETAHEIRKIQTDETPIILVSSAYDWSDIEEEARGAGISGFVSKPLFKSTLYHELKPFMLGGEQPQVDKKADDGDFTGKRILVAEDNDLNWEIAEALLSTLGFELEHAENGKICVDMFSNSKLDYYDAILMDLRMPVMTGYEATDAIRKLERVDASEIPIIAMTADAFSDDKKKCLDAGMNAHIAKPIDIHDVAKVLSKFINK